MVIATTALAATVAPKVIIPAFFLSEKLLGVDDGVEIANTIAFSLLFAFSVILLFQGKLPWLAAASGASALYFYRRMKKRDPHANATAAIGVPLLTYGLATQGFPPLASLAAGAHIVSYAVHEPITHSMLHTVGLMVALFLLAWGRRGGEWYEIF
jgi:hypothetical protein